MLTHRNGHSLRTLDGMVNRVFADLAATSGRAPAYVPSVDLWETDEAWGVEADLPGTRLEDIEVAYHDGILTVRGERLPGQIAGQGRVRRERFHGAFLREIPLNGDVDGEGIEATYHSGVLRVRIPKLATARPRRIEVKAGEPASDA